MRVQVTMLLPRLSDSESGFKRKGSPLYKDEPIKKKKKTKTDDI